MAPWWKRVRECLLFPGPAGELAVTLGGGADQGEFPFLAAVCAGKLRPLVGGVQEGDLLLEVNSTPVFGLTLGDTLGILKTCRDPVMLRTIAPGTDLSRDLSEFLQRSCSCDSHDSQLQRIVRENLYLRAVPCTTREPRDGEIPGVDYNFISTQGFLALQGSGLLLESGTHKGHYYGTPRPPHVAEGSAMTQREPRRRTWDPDQRYSSIIAQEALGELSDEGEQEEEDGQPEVLLGLHTAASGGSASLTLQNGDLGLRREIPGCVDPPSATGGPSALLLNRKKETAENHGLNFSGQVAPMLQVVRGSSGTERGTATCGDVLVVVHGNCIVEYSRGEGLTLHPAGTAGGLGEGIVSKQRLRPPVPPPRAPACGQEAESEAKQESTGKRPREPAQPEARGPPRAAPTSAVPKAPLNIPVLGPPCLPLPSYSATSSRHRADTEAGSVRRQTEQQKGGREGNKPASEPANHGNSDPPAPPTARLTPVPIGRSSSGLGFQVTSAGPGRGATVGNIWDRRVCPLLAEGDVIVKANGADLRHLSAQQVQEVLRQHALESDLILLVQREVMSLPVPQATPVSDVTSTRLPGTSRHRPVLRRTATEEEATLGRVPACPPSPEAGSRARGGRHGRMRESESIRLPVGVQAKGGTEAAPRTQAPQVSSHALGGEQDHARGKKMRPHRGVFPASRPTRPLLEASDGRAAQDDAVKATSFTDPAPRDLLLGRHSLLRSLTEVASQPSRASRDPSRPGSEVSVPILTPDSATDEAERPLLPPGLIEVVLERKENEGFGFVIVSEIPASGQARSLVPHRFSEVRQDSPASHEGRLKVGDRLEGVDGRSIVHMSPREITQLFRQAGNKIRLRILPKSKTGGEGSSDAAEIEVDEKRMPFITAPQGSRETQSLGPKDPQPELVPAKECRQYLVELQRGPTGFGFSLRGGSEYKMNLYVLGIMEGGPAQRSGMMQVSDRLMEINGTSTAGMTHAEAVELIRSEGSKIRLLLRRGDGNVPDYDCKHPRSPSSELLQEVSARLEQRKPDMAADPQHGPPALEEGDIQRVLAAPCDASTRENTHHVNSGAPRCHRKEPRGLTGPETGERTSPVGRGHPSGRREEEVVREGRPRSRRPGVRRDTLTTGTLLGRKEDPPHGPPRECKSLSPQRDRAAGRGQPRGTSSLLGPWLRSSVEPGPWLVPSQERLAHILCKDSSTSQRQVADGGFSGEFWDMEAGEREKGKGLWREEVPSRH